VEPSGRKQYCNRYAKRKKAWKSAENNLSLIPRFGRIVKNSDTWPCETQRRSTPTGSLRIVGHAVLPAGPGDLTTYCDLTQSWSAKGGGVGTYIRHKRQHLIDHTPHRHLLIIPGETDATSVEERGRAITVTIASPKVPGSPNYRLLLRNGAVRAALAEHRPDLIECQDAYNLPWAAIAHRRAYPATALVAAYCTDFPSAYVERGVRKLLGAPLARGAARLAYAYVGNLYRRFDAAFAMSEHGGAAKLRALGVVGVDVVPLGVALGEFSPANRSPELRSSIGVAVDEPLILYAGRLDSEKQAAVVAEAFLQLPEKMRATLVLLGDGPLRAPLTAKLAGQRAFLPGFINDRVALARWLASADLYATAMADETFGISVIEAQASGLPVVGVAAGAMIDRITPAIGRIGPIGNASAMARNLIDLWAGDVAAMGAAARDHAQQFSWEISMSTLFGKLYQHALLTAAARRNLVWRGAITSVNQACAHPFISRSADRLHL
jgi:alpha-1,6-mannosyltransferase